MVPTLFFYQLVLIALVWLCLMCHWMWPSAPATCLPVVRNIVTRLTLGADLHLISRHAASGGSSIQLANCAGGSTSTKSAWLRVTKIC